MLDDMFDHLEQLRTQPVWQAPPQTVRRRFDADLPHQGAALEDVHTAFMADIAPYASGNLHPGFMGWVQGGGTPVGMLAEMLAAGLNANLGGRNHMAIEVERQIVRWMAQLFGFPAEASGLFLTGSSIANFCAVLIARIRLLGPDIRLHGLNAGEGALCAYTSAAAHGCIRRAMEMSGSGGEALRSIPVDARQRMRVDDLRAAIAADRAAGRRPFLVVATVGTVDTGAIDDLVAIGAVARAEGLHFHIDGAFGALGILSDRIAPRLTGIESADSIAFDFHKWAQVPYDAGFLLVRDQAAHRATFANEAGYLTRAASGLAGGDWWPCDFGPDLSRGFRALKVWFSLKTYGLDGLGAVVDRTCALAQGLARCVSGLDELELLAPVELNIVCFRYRGADRAAAPDLDALNAAIVEDLHAEGRVAPSMTTLGGRTAIRAAIVNHRTGQADIEALVLAVMAAGRRRLQAIEARALLAA
jgi:glutamate/tyrosine decarboxylase-like PLP-dependent enzyme